MEPFNLKYYGASDDYRRRFYDGINIEYDDRDILDNVVFDFANFITTTNTVLMDTITFKECDGRISLAYERLSVIPKTIAEKFSQSTHTLDLSHNNIKDLSFLSNFDILNTLILDKNTTLDIKTLPALSNLKILWLNNCNIRDMAKWIKHIKTCCPNLKHLSLLGNPGIQSLFNGASILEHNDYRMYVLSLLPNLQYLDDTFVTESQRNQAKEHEHLYTIAGTPLKFVNKFGSTGQIHLFRHDNGKKFTDILSTDSSGNHLY